MTGKYLKKSKNCPPLKRSKLTLSAGKKEKSIILAEIEKERAIELNKENIQNVIKKWFIVAEKVVPIMNEEELKTLIFSHFENEVQPLTSGAEANLLKFKELTETLNSEEQTRWIEIKKTFVKNKVFRNIDENNPMAQVLAQMSAFTDGIEGIREVLDKAVKKNPKKWLGL